MEGFFCIFPKFFKPPAQPADRTQQKGPEKGYQVGKPSPQKKDGRAQKEKVGNAPQDHPRHEVEPHHPVSGRHRIDKEGDDRQGPVNEVQHRPQGPPPQPPPEKAKEVIGEPQPAPQGRGP